MGIYIKPDYHGENQLIYSVFQEMTDTNSLSLANFVGVCRRVILWNRNGICDIFQGHKDLSWRIFL